MILYLITAGPTPFAHIPSSHLFHFPFPASKPKMRSHYRGHKMAVWLNLIPQLHQPGDDVSMRHHHFHEREPHFYAGELRFTFIFGKKWYELNWKFHSISLRKIPQSKLRGWKHNFHECGTNLSHMLSFSGQKQFKWEKLVFFFIYDHSVDEVIQLLIFKKSTENLHRCIDIQSEPLICTFILTV